MPKSRYLGLSKHLCPNCKSKLVAFDVKDNEVMHMVIYKCSNRNCQYELVSIDGAKRD